jgi:hypothetical protein
MNPRAARALAAVLLLAACRKSQPRSETPPEPPPPALGTITVEEVDTSRDHPEGVQLDVRALEARAREALAGAGVFAPGGGPDGGARSTARVRVQVALEEVAVADKAAARAVLRLRIDVRPSQGMPRRWQEDVEAGAEVPYKPSEKPDRSALFQKLVGRALDDLLRGYTGRLKLWSGPPAAIEAALTADAGELRVEAIHAIAERKLSAEAPILLKLLDADDEVIRDAALGALVELRDRRAVSVLAQGRSLRDRREMRKILDAIALLGGEEAADYLAFVADGHEDPEIKKLATEARQRMLRRADAGR